MRKIFCSKKGFFGDVVVDIIALFALVVMFTVFSIILSFISDDIYAEHKLEKTAASFDSDIEMMQFLRSPVEVDGHMTDYAQYIRMAAYDNSLRKKFKEDMDRFVENACLNSGFMLGIRIVVQNADNKQEDLFSRGNIPPSGDARSVGIYEASDERCMQQICEPVLYLPGYETGEKIAVKMMVVPKEAYVLHGYEIDALNERCTVKR